MKCLYLQIHPRKILLNFCKLLPCSRINLLDFREYGKIGRLPPRKDWRRAFWKGVKDGVRCVWNGHQTA